MPVVGVRPLDRIPQQDDEAHVRKAIGDALRRVEDRRDSRASLRIRGDELPRTAHGKWPRYQRSPSPNRREKYSVSLRTDAARSGALRGTCTATTFRPRCVPMIMKAGIARAKLVTFRRRTR